MDVSLLKIFYQYYFLPKCDSLYTSYFLFLYLIFFNYWKDIFFVLIINTNCWHLSNKSMILFDITYQFYFMINMDHSILLSPNVTFWWWKISVKRPRKKWNLDLTRCYNMDINKMQFSNNLAFKKLFIK